MYVNFTFGLQKNENRLGRVYWLGLDRVWRNSAFIRVAVVQRKGRFSYQQSLRWVMRIYECLPVLLSIMGLSTMAVFRDKVVWGRETKKTSYQGSERRALLKWTASWLGWWAGGEHEQAVGRGLHISGIPVRAECVALTAEILVEVSLRVLEVYKKTVWALRGGIRR